MVFVQTITMSHVGAAQSTGPLLIVVEVIVTARSDPKPLPDHFLCDRSLAHGDPAGALEFGLKAGKSRCDQGNEHRQDA